MITEGKSIGTVAMEELLEAYETHRAEVEGDTTGTEALEIAASLRPMIAAEVVQVLDDKAKPGVDGEPRCGRRMRAILRELKKSPENKLSRPQLEDALVEVEHDRSNTLRAIRALVRAGSVVFTDARRKGDSYVRLSPPTEPLPESEVWKILQAIMDKDRADTQKGGD